MRQRTFPGPLVTLSLRTYMLLFLLVLSIGPLIAISLINLHNVEEHLASMEVEYEGNLLQLRLSPLESRIRIYDELVGFVSQLPAVAEMLDRGGARAGSIGKARARVRYTGVITRVFKKYPDIVNVHIFDTQGRERLHIERRADQTFHIKAYTLDRLEGAVSSEAAGTADSKVRIIPKIVEGRDMPRLLLQMMVPIRLEKETIGLYVSDVDVGVLSKSFPDVHWVLGDGRYLSARDGGRSAFERFPGLKTVFTAGRPALWGGGVKMIWRPLYRGAAHEPVLWAGQEVRGDVARKARERIYFWSIAAGAGLGFFILVTAYLLSVRVQRFFSTLLKLLEAAVIHEAPSVQTESARIAEVNIFMDKLSELADAHSRLELERQTAQDALRQSEQMMWTVANGVQSAVILIDQADIIRFVNPAAERIFGYPKEELLGKALHETLVPERFRNKVRDGMAGFARSGKGPVLRHSLELLALRKDGTELPIELWVGRVRKNGQWWAVGAAVDIAERKVKEEALTRLAETDPLTGMNNRRHFLLLATQEFKRCRRYQCPVFFLMFDLDHFKNINDTFGHAIGDEVLKSFTRICAANLRESDLFGRIGGEEFASVLAGLEQDQVLAVAERIRRAFTRVTVRDGEDSLSIHAGVSVGITAGDPDGETVEAAMKRADEALYQAKDQGRNQVVIK